MQDKKTAASSNGAIVAGKLSVLIPAYNEADNLGTTIRNIVAALEDAEITHEILVVNDNSTDGTEQELAELEKTFPALHHLNNSPPNGFGLALQTGLKHFDGDAVVIVMADGSDDPQDIIVYWRKLAEGYDCVFGSRFMSGARVVDYPLHKKVLNRLANNFIRMVFRIGYNDVTNSFKCYRREVIIGLQPILSHHFNLTVELPLKVIIRGFSYAVVPTHWYNRKFGVSKLRIREMGSRYLFIVLYCLIERWLSGGDYRSRRK
jgi:dolichol-phosphate mannosyltransferase